MGYQIKDVFVSFKRDGTGESFANLLAGSLKNLGYDVFISDREKHSGTFPEGLRDAVRGCRDFVFVASAGYLEDLAREGSWVREELTLAREALGTDRIIRVNVRTRVTEYDGLLRADEKVAFVTELNDITMKAGDFEESPLQMLASWMSSKPWAASNNGGKAYSLVENGSSDFDAHADFCRTAKAAEAGDPQAMYELATMCYYGLQSQDGNPKRDYPQAYQWFGKLSALDGEHRSHASSMLGRMHYRGLVPLLGQSFERAHDLLESSEEKAGSDASHLAWMESIGLGCEFDFERAERSFLDAAKTDALAKFNLGEFYRGFGLFDKAAEQYRAIAGVSSRAAHALGLMYKRGVLSSPPRPDPFQAEYYYLKAASLGPCEAQVYHDLGHLYFCPTAGFQKDFEKARHYYRTAADLGDADSQYMTGVMYSDLYDFGLEKDSELAIKYHRLAAAQGHLLSATDLALLYQSGAHRNYAEAFRYAQQSARGLYAEGCFHLGNLLFLGRGCAPDTSAAYQQYRLAYERGFEPALFMMRRIERLAGLNPTA